MSAVSERQAPSGIEPGDYVCFWDFFQLFIEFQEIQLPLKPFHEYACNTIEDAVLGVTEWPWIIINMPPRSGKTKLLEALACWLWAYFGDAQMIYTTYASSLVERSMDYVAKVLQSEWYQDIFRDQLHSKRLDYLTTTAGGQMHGEGTGGSLTGKGAGLKRPAGGYIAIDDANKPEEALSVTVSDTTKRWLHTTLITRRNSSRWCPIILCGHRLGPEDLYGYVEREYKGSVLKIVIDAIHELPDGTEESVIPETIAIKDLQDMRSTRYGRYVLASQYRQQPVSLGGNLIQVGSFKRYTAEDLLRIKAWDRLVIVVDTALKVKEVNDFSALHLWGKAGPFCYLLDRMHGKWESPQLLESAILFNNKCRELYDSFPLRFIIEEKAAGTGLLQQMRQKHIPVEGIERDIDKVRRVQAMIPYQEAGLVWLPEDKDQPWVIEVINECAAFTPTMTHAHDDDVDCVCDGVHQLLGGKRGILDM